MKCRIKNTPKANNGLQVEGNQYEMLSPETLLLKGDSHENGGQQISYMGKRVEAEGGEPIAINKNGDAVVYGNLQVPGTKRTFKSVAKSIGREEGKVNKLQDKSTDLVLNNNPYDPYSSLSFNTGSVLQDAVDQKSEVLKDKKEQLADMQQFILDLSETTGKKPEKIAKTFAKGGTLSSYKDGGNIGRYKAALRRAAILNDLNPDILVKLSGVESGYNPKAVSPKNALGIMQFTPETAKQYGLTEADLRSTDPNVVEKVISKGVQHFKKLYRQNNNDYGLALAAYNGGQDAVNFVKKETKNPNITSGDWLDYMRNRREEKPSSNPHAWQNETYDYLNNILGPNPLGPSVNFDPSLRFITPNNPEEAKGKYMEEAPIRTPESPLGMMDTQPLIPIKTSITSNPFSPATQKSPADTNISNSVVSPVSSAADYNKLGISDFASEIPAILDRADYVQGFKYEPQLYQPYQVSFQDRINQNNSSFRSVAQQIPNNPAALSVLAAQKYNADNQVLAEQFRVNQQVANEVTNQNTGLLNQAMLQNLQLQDQQYARQEQARAITQSHRQQALASLSQKAAQNRVGNSKIRMYESLSDYRPDKNLIINYEGSPTQFGPYSVTSQDPQYLKAQSDYLEAEAKRIKSQQAAQKSTKKWGGFLSKKK